MFDYHMHSALSFDGHSSPEEMVRAAEAAGLKEICFTDHIDRIFEEHEPMLFSAEDYAKAYDSLNSDRVLIRRGVEYGMRPRPEPQMDRDLAMREFDYVIGSVHFAEDLDVYFAPFWEGKTVEQAYRVYLQHVYDCLKTHDNFDVLGHLTYICKARANPTHELLRYEDHRELLDEILRLLAAKGKGMEMNTSGVDRCGGFLPTADFFRRFKELGGQIVTVGSDAHTADRVGQYSREACEILKDIFGYVCTFEKRNPIFHKL